MKKRLVYSLILVITCMFIGLTNVSAKECTAHLQAPQIPQYPNWNIGHIVSLKTAANVCKGSNTEAWFSSFGTLPSWYTPGGGGVIWIELYEDDPAGNDDERVKEYVAHLNGRVISSVEIYRTYITGNIDSQGDQTCELYIRTQISQNASGSIYTAIPQGMFNYRLCMN